MNTVKFDENNLALSEGTVRVYDCHSVTKEYMGFTDEKLTVGVGLPAHSYLDEPPESKDGFAICRVEGQWQYLPDFRGQTAYNKKTTKSVEIKELGELSDELTLVKPETEFDYWDGQSWRTNVEQQKEHQIKQVDIEKQYRLNQAEKQLAVLQRAIKFDIATEEEIQLAEQLEIYSVLVNRIDSQQAPDIDWPEMPNS